MLASQLQSCQLSRIELESHAFHHILTLIYMLISHAPFFSPPCQRFVMHEGYPYYVPAKSRQKFWGRKKMEESPPPRSSAFLGLARLYRLAQRTALAFLTPNPHPMLAALQLGMLDASDKFVTLSHAMLLCYKIYERTFRFIIKVKINLGTPYTPFFLYATGIRPVSVTKSIFSG